MIIRIIDNIAVRIMEVSRILIIATGGYMVMMLIYTIMKAIFS